MTRIVAVLVMATLAVAGTGASGQVPGRVTGVVHDSTAGAPLAGAGVFLWATPHRATTDARGRFVLDSVPPGTYDLFYFHPRLGRLGLSPGPTPVTVGSGRATDVALATPSMPTVLSALCAAEGGTGGVVVGQVSDGASAVPLPGALVRASWVPPGARAARTVEARADDEGWYRACDLPTEARVALVGDFLGRASPRREVELEPLQVRAVDLAIGPSATAALRGRVVDGATGEGIGDAEVWLDGTSRRLVSAPDGGFAFPDLVAGAYTLGVRHVAYGTRTDSLDVAGGGAVTVRVTLDTRAVALEPLTVTVDATRIEDRAIGGTLVGPPDIDRVRARARDMADVLRALRVPGVVVRRGADGLCIGFTQGQARLFRTGCVPALLYIDDVRAADPQVAASLPLEVIDRIILLRPLEAGNLYGMGSASGVVLVYTKNR